MLIFRDQVVYILDQVRALENEMLQRIKNQGLDIIPRILIVCFSCPFYVQLNEMMVEIS